MSEVLIDNASIYSASMIFYKTNIEKRRIREINLSALENIIEAYLLNDTINIDIKYYDILMKNVPDKWRKYISKVFIPLDFSFKENLINLDTFLSSEIVYWLLNIEINKNINKTPIRQDFFSYTGNDFENYKISQESLLKINSILKIKWDWNYHSSNLSHIDEIMMNFRTIEYIDFANNNNMSLITHPLRNSFLNEYACLLNINKQDGINYEFYNKIREKIIDNNSQHIFSTINNLTTKGEIFFDKIQMPYLAALVFENCYRIENVFEEAYKFRKKLSRFREKLRIFEDDFNNSNFKSTDAISSEIHYFIKDLQIKPENLIIEQTLSYGGDLLASTLLGIMNQLGIEKSLKFKKTKYLKIFTEINNRYSLPKSYKTSCNRLFGDIMWKAI